MALQDLGALVIDDGLASAPGADRDRLGAIAGPEAADIIVSFDLDVIATCRVAMDDEVLRPELEVGREDVDAEVHARDADLVLDNIGAGVSQPLGRKHRRAEREPYAPGIALSWLLEEPRRTYRCVLGDEAVAFAAMSFEMEGDTIVRDLDRLSRFGRALFLRLEVLVERLRQSGLDCQGDRVKPSVNYSHFLCPHFLYF